MWQIYLIEDIWEKNVKDFGTNFSLPVTYFSQMWLLYRFFHIIVKPAGLAL